MARILRFIQPRYLVAIVQGQAIVFSTWKHPPQSVESAESRPPGSGERAQGIPTLLAGQQTEDGTLIATVIESEVARTLLLKGPFSPREFCHAR